MDSAGIFLALFIACSILGGTTCAIVEEHGKWQAYSNCLIHHTPDDCKLLRP